MSRVFLTVSIEGIRKLPQIGSREQLVIENSNSCTFEQLQEIIRKFYCIPSDCKFFISLFFSHQSTNEDKDYLPPEMDEFEFRTQLDLYAIRVDDHRTVNVHLYPVECAVIPLAFTTNNRFPQEGLIDFDATNLIQQCPIGFINYHWDGAKLLTEIQKLINHYVLKFSKMKSSLTSENIILFSEDGSEHVLPETIRNNDHIIVQISDYSMAVDSTMISLCWEDLPLITTETVRGTVVTPAPPPPPMLPRPLPVTPTREEKLSAFSPPLRSNTTTSTTTIFDLKPSGDDTHRSNNDIHDNNPLTPQQKDLEAKLSEFGVSLTGDSLKRLSFRSSTIEGAINYYLENSELFPSEEETKEPQQKEEEDEVVVEKNESEEKLSSSSSHEDSLSEIDYMMDDPPGGGPASFILVAGATNNESNKIVFPPSPPSPPAVAPAKPITIPTNNYTNEQPPQPQESTRKSNFSAPRNESYYNQFKAVGFELNELQIEELFKRASTFDGMINYYLSNHHLFHGNNSNNSYGFEEKDRTPSPAIEKYCSICLIPHPMNEMYQIDCTCGHYFCIESLLQCVKTSVNGTQDTASHIPACPLANLKDGGCKYVLSEKECEQIIFLALEMPHQNFILYTEAEALHLKMKKLFLVRKKACTLFFSLIFIVLFSCLLDSSLL
jgi:hypothetical protein